MELSERELGDRGSGATVVVDVAGTVGRDTTAPTELLARVRGLVARGYKNILLNLAQVTYMDSLMLGALVQGYVSSVKQGSSLKLVEPTARLREMLTLTKLDTVFEMLEAEAAMQPLGQHPEPKDTP